MMILLSIVTSVIICGIVVFFILHPQALRVVKIILIVLLLALFCLELLTRGIQNLSAGGGIVGSAILVWLGWRVILIFING